MNKFTIFLLGVLVGFVCSKLVSKQNDIKPQCNYETKTDTVTEYKIIRDTAFVERPKLCKEIIRDTVWLDSLLDNDYNHLIVSQKEYRDSDYVAWVSGIEPQLDSIMVFKNTEYVFKTSTIKTVKTIEDKTGKWYTGAGIYMIENDFIPKLNIAYQKKDVIAGASVGIYNKKTVFGLDINIKIK